MKYVFVILATVIFTKTKKKKLRSSCVISIEVKMQSNISPILMPLYILISLLEHELIDPS
jgi:hypothetical protein